MNFLADRPHALPRLGLGDHAAADAGGHRHRYFQRFMARFPDLTALAAAELDEVLHLWSGLGYYARARNLRRAARLIRAEHHGEFPRGLAAVEALPGIGRSTAGAILAQSRDERCAILDGNARRVLARYFAVEGPVSDASVLRELWRLAQSCTPPREVAAYTQAIMDLGATLCVRGTGAIDLIAPGRMFAKRIRLQADRYEALRSSLVIAGASDVTRRRKKR